MSGLSITDAEFDQIRSLVYKHFGINLTEQKKSLVIGRLQKILRQLGFDQFQQYYDHVVADTSGDALNDLVNQISTNHTFFFREKEHFDFFTATALPEAIERARQAGRKKLRVWCAGCSSGEEAYTLALLMMETLGHDYPNWDAGVLATDISAKVLSIAQAGIYADDRVELIPEAFKRRYFVRRREGDWEVSAALKAEVTYRRFNLMNAQFPFKCPFDVIFCRNVMIYFDQPTRDALIDRYYAFTNPGGYLFIGHSESLRRERCPYRYISPAIYRREVV
ncbi:MAG: CheR family methyltransferase [Planctomycetota bacterium]|jgi:chemotaxis protein methyltransferase CheR